MTSTICWMVGSFVLHSIENSKLNVDTSGNERRTNGLGRPASLSINYGTRTLILIVENRINERARRTTQAPLVGKPESDCAAGMARWHEHKRTDPSETSGGAMRMACRFHSSIALFRQVFYRWGGSRHIGFLPVVSGLVFVSAAVYVCVCMYAGAIVEQREQ